jgi:hypothetical protein
MPVWHLGLEGRKYLDLELDAVEPECSLTAVSALSYECIASAKLAALQNSLRRSQ